MDILLSNASEIQEKDYNLMLSTLTQKIEQYIIFQPDEELKESIVEAFISRIIVSKDEFKWFLRVNNDFSKTCNYLEQYIIIASFTITLDDAKAYLYAISPRKRVHRWFDLNVSIWI